MQSLNANALDAALYHYRCRIVSIYDGDTMTVDLDLGMDMWALKQKIRFMRINCPELKGPTHIEGKAARDYMESLVKDREVVIQTIKDAKEKFGRYLGEVWAKGDDGNFFNVNDALVVSGHAVYKEY